MKYLTLLTALSILISGCIDAAVVQTYKYSQTKMTNEKFMEHFNKTNIEREKAGLPPLDLCTEKYHFDEKWADDDPECKERISRYEAGDTKALGNTKLGELDQENTNTVEPEYQRTGDENQLNLNP